MSVLYINFLSFICNSLIICYICASFGQELSNPNNISMNKTGLVNEIAAKAQLNKVDAKKALEATLETIAEALKNEDKVQLIGFGTFAVVDKPERTGINPLTKEKIVIPARKVVKFKPAAELGK